MAAPSPSWNTVRVHGTWVNQNGTKKAGTYAVKIPVRIANATDDVIVPRGTFASGALNLAEGQPSLDVQVPAGDDPDNSPSGVQAVLKVSFTDRSPTETYVLTVPVSLSGDADGINLRSVVLAAALQTPVPFFLRGVAGGLAELDADGDVIDADGVKVISGGGGFTGTAEDITDGANKKLMLATERAKLAGIDTGATANAPDATLLARASHTGTQPSTSISDFTEAAQDAVAALLAQGTGVTLSYNDAGNTLTVTSTGSGGITDPEVVRDTIGAALLGVGVISVAVNDAADTITISCTATSNSTDAALRDRATHTGTQSSDTLTDGTTSKTFLATERTKLAGVATGATANDTDANLKARGNHTGSQLASTISDFAAAVALLVTTKLGLKNNADVDLTASTDAAVNYKILDDGTSSSGWPNRLSFGFTPSGGVFHLTGWFNEYGELRLTPGKNNTIPFRIFAAETAAVYATRSMTEAMIQLVDNRVDRVEKFNVYANGNLLTVGSLTGASLSVSGAVTAASVTASGAVAGSNIAQKTRCVPTGTTGFATEPDGTLWVEYTP